MYSICHCLKQMSLDLPDTDILQSVSAYLEVISLSGMQVAHHIIVVSAPITIQFQRLGFSIYCTMRPATITVVRVPVNDIDDIDGQPVKFCWGLPGDVGSVRCAGLGCHITRWGWDCRDNNKKYKLHLINKITDS